MPSNTAHIFRGGIGSGHEEWLEAVCGLENAERRMEQIAAAEPGLYFVFNIPSHVVVASADTTDIKLPSTRAFAPRKGKIA